MSTRPHAPAAPERPRATAAAALAAALPALAALAAPSDARAQAAPQPMDFYGAGILPATDVSVAIVGLRDRVEYTAVVLATRAVFRTGRVDRHEVEIFTVPGGAPFRVTTTDVAMVGVGTTSLLSTGSLTYPTDDGVATVGRRFVVWVPPSFADDWYVAAHEAATVTLRAPDGATLATRALAAGEFWVDPQRSPNAVRIVEATANVSVGANAGNAYTTAPVGDAPAAGCQNDAGRRFLARVRRGLFTGGALAAFGYGPAAATLTAALRPDPMPGALVNVTGFVGPNGATLLADLPTGSVVVQSSAPVALWPGSLSAAPSIDALADDVAFHVGAPEGATGQRVVVRSQDPGAVVFAGEDATDVRASLSATPGGAGTVMTTRLNRDGVLLIPPHQHAVITSNRPIVVETRAASGESERANDWGAWIRPMPRSDSDGDGILDRVEGPPCQSVAQDRDTNGVPDFLERVVPDAGRDAAADAPPDDAPDASDAAPDDAPAPDAPPAVGLAYRGGACTCRAAPRADPRGRPVALAGALLAAAALARRQGRAARRRG